MNKVGNTRGCGSGSVSDTTLPVCARRATASRRWRLHLSIAGVLLVFPFAARTDPQLAAVPADASAILQTDTQAQALDGMPEVSSEVSVSDRGLVQLHVADLPLSTVLRMLSIESRRNIIASPSVTGTVTANLYDVTFEEALDSVLVTNGAGYRAVGNFIYVYTKQELDRMASAAKARPVVRMFHLNYISAADAAALIEPILGEGEDRIGSVSKSPAPQSGIAGGSRIASGSRKSGGTSYAAQDFLVVTAPFDVMADVEKLIRAIDVRPKQVLIEATILRAKLSDDNALGVNFSIVGGVDLQELGARSTGIANLALGELPQDRFELFNSIASTDFASDVPDGGLSIGIIKDNVAVFLRALEQVTDTTVLANPKVLALNKQRGQIIVGRRDGYLTTTVTETQAVQSVEFLETGTQLMFRPFIGNDGFIRMELHPEDSVGFVNAQGLPSEQTTEVTTSIIIRDGDTILIAGLFREVTTDARNQVPVLGNLPLIGSLFRSKADSTSREEVIILLTVHIVKDHAVYADASMEELRHIERLRLGSRQGLMWHGAERMARLYYDRALDSQDEGDADKAVWHANMALHASPRFVPAIRLKERILGKREWEDEGEMVRMFLYRLIAKERGYAYPEFGPSVRSPAADTVGSETTEDNAAADSRGGANES